MATDEPRVGAAGLDRLDRRGFLRAGAALALTACTLPLPTRGSGPSDVLAFMDATATAEGLARGELLPRDVIEASLGRIEALDPALSVIAHSAMDRALARMKSGRLDAPFGSVPILLKDMVDCRGVVRSDGASRLFWRVPERSPALIQAIEKSGLVVLGTTNVPEFATLPVTINETFGATKNPWDPTRSPGGSSGGSAAAVAAGMVPLAHATDGSGSIRMPASCCGVFGFKPSRSRARSGEADGGHPLLKHHHCITRSVRDSLAFLHVSEDRAAGATYPTIFGERWPHEGGAPVRRLRIGVDRAGIAGTATDEHVAAALEASITLLEDLGHEVIEMPRLFGAGKAFWHHLEALFLGRMPALITLVESATGQPFEETEVLSPFTKSFAHASRAESPESAAYALDYFAGLRPRVLDWMGDIDVIVSPVMPEGPPPIDRWTPDSLWEEEQAGLRDYMNHTPLANVIGAPAMSVPLHWTPGGWPIGTQFQARPGDDRLLFELAFELEAARPWADRRPPISA